MNTRRKTLFALTGVTALSVWHKPLVKSVITPAHAQMSPPVDPPVDPPVPPQDVCPMITFGNLTSGPVSGTNVPPVCNATFEILSADAATPITIISIENSALPADTTLDIQDLGAATDGSGPRVIWRGPATDAPSCSDIVPTGDITFTVTATCEAANMGEYQQTFSLAAILSA